MILSRPRERTEARAQEQFHLFKPLLLLALGVFFFELLPIDFQHALAPQLVSFEEVFEADRRNLEIPSLGVDEMISSNAVEAEGLSLKPAAMSIRN